MLCLLRWQHDTLPDHSSRWVYLAMECQVVIHEPPAHHADSTQSAEVAVHTRCVPDISWWGRQCLQAEDVAGQVLAPVQHVAHVHQLLILCLLHHPLCCAREGLVVVIHHVAHALRHMPASGVLPV